MEYITIDFNLDDYCFTGIDKDFLCNLIYNKLIKYKFNVDKFNISYKLLYKDNVEFYIRRKSGRAEIGSIIIKKYMNKKDYTFMSDCYKLTFLNGEEKFYDSEIKLNEFITIDNKKYNTNHIISYENVGKSIDLIQFVKTEIENFYNK